MFSHLYIAFVGTPVSIHTLHSGLFAVQQVDTKEWSPSHGILHTGIMRWQIHPANDEQPVHLSETSASVFLIKLTFYLSSFEVKTNVRFPFFYRLSSKQGQQTVSCSICVLSFLSEIPTTTLSNPP